MVSVTAVVTSLEFVHIIPTVLVSLFNLARTRRLREIAGALCLSRVSVVFSTDLLWSEISISCQPYFLDSQNSILFVAVLGEGK